MINVFDPATVMGILTLAAFEPNSVCQIPQPAQINVIPSAAPVEYDLSQSREQLQSQKIDTINPYGFDTQSHTNGFMKGTITMRPHVKLDYKTVFNGRAVCIWYEKIDLKIAIDPAIVIAKEVAEDNCMYAAVKEHELKHVNVDRKIVNKYAKTMGRKIFDGLQSRGFIVGPVSVEQAQDVAQRMQSTVSQLIELEYKKLEIDRAESQQAVDSLEEYTRVSNLCPQRQRYNRSRSTAGANRSR